MLDPLIAISHAKQTFVELTTLTIITRSVNDMSNCQYM